MDTDWRFGPISLFLILITYIYGGFKLVISR